MITLSPPSSLSLVAPRYAAPAITSRGITLVRVGDALWRVQRSDRDVILGHLRAAEDPLGVRWRAERLHLATGTFRLVGDFWSPDDAVSALRG